MPKAELLRVQDVRDAYRLIGDCRDLGGDPALWNRRMLEGVRRLVGVPAATGGEGRTIRPHRAIEVISALDAGFDSRGHELHMAYQRKVGPDGDPVFRVLQRLPGRHVVRTRRQLVSDSTWYRSVAWNEYLRPGNMDDRLTSVFQSSDEGAFSVIVLVRAPGRTGILAARAAASELLPRGARQADRPLSRQRYRAAPRRAVAPTSADARVAPRGRQREAARLALRPERGDDPSVRDRPLPPFRSPEPRPAHGPCDQASRAKGMEPLLTKKGPLPRITERRGNSPGLASPDP